MKPGAGLDAVRPVRHLPHAELYQDELGVPDAGRLEGRGDEDADALGAPIDEDTADTIIKYLSANYAAQPKP